MNDDRKIIAKQKIEIKTEEQSIPQAHHQSPERKTLEAPITGRSEPEKEISPRPDISTHNTRKATLESFVAVLLPKTVVLSEKVQLLNAAGKEVTIPEYSSIKIITRSPHGTLTMEIDGNIFVGNEERLAGKFKSD